MSTWQPLAGHTVLFTPIGLQPVDHLTGRGPVGALRVHLDARQPDGSWLQTDIRPVVTLGGTYTYPALGRARAPLGQLPSRFRVRVDADHYIPQYLREQDGIEFDCFPYNDSVPPQSSPAAPEQLFLLPGPTYPFPGHLVVLRGMVVDAGGVPVSGAEVWIVQVRCTLSDARGCFALPAPRPAAPATIQLKAADLRTGRRGAAAVQFPQGLGTNVRIVIS